MNALDPNRYDERRGRWSGLGSAHGSTVGPYQKATSAVGNFALMFALLAVTAGGVLAFSAAAPGGIPLSSAAQEPEPANAVPLQNEETATADILQAQLRATANAAASTDRKSVV